MKVVKNRQKDINAVASNMNPTKVLNFVSRLLKDLRYNVNVILFVFRLSSKSVINVTIYNNRYIYDIINENGKKMKRIDPVYSNFLDNLDSNFKKHLKLDRKYFDITFMRVTHKNDVYDHGDIMNILKECYECCKLDSLKSLNDINAYQPLMDTEPAFETTDVIITLAA